MDTHQTDHDLDCHGCQLVPPPRRRSSKVLLGKNIQPRILYSARLFFRYQGEIKGVTDKQKLREFGTTNAKGASLDGKGNNWKPENYKWESSPVKANIKAGNHPQEVVISKLAIVRTVQILEYCRILESIRNKENSNLKQSYVHT